MSAAAEILAEIAVLGGRVSRNGHVAGAAAPAARRADTPTKPRIKALLALQGISGYQSLCQDRRARLAELRRAEGQPIPPRCRAEIDCEMSRLEMVLKHIAEVDAALVPAD